MQASGCRLFLLLSLTFKNVRRRSTHAALRAGTDGEDDHGVDGRLAMDMPRPAEDDYEDGLQDMDMMPGDMGMGMGGVHTSVMQSR